MKRFPQWKNCHVLSMCACVRVHSRYTNDNGCERSCNNEDHIVPCRTAFMFTSLNVLKNQRKRRQEEGAFAGTLVRTRGTCVDRTAS